MTDYNILETIKKFLEDNVAAKIQLQRPEDNIDSYTLVNPAVHKGYIPSEAMLPPELTHNIPCILVGHEDGKDDGQEATLNIRITFAVYGPGAYDNESVCTPSFRGYNDLLNLCTLTRRELAAGNIEGITIEMPFKWGMYKVQPYPYWHGWLTFSVPCSSMEHVPTITEQYL